MDPLARVKELLTKKSIICIEDKQSIGVKPADRDGFEVGMYVTPANKHVYYVHYDGWHEVFIDAGEAVDAFMTGLTNKVRLKTEMRGKTASKWTLEYMKNNEWVEDSTTGAFMYPFWIKPQIRFQQNNWLKPTEYFEMIQKELRPIKLK